MHEQTGKTQQNKNQSVAGTITQKKSSNESTFQLVDNRPEVVTQRILQETAHNSPQAKNAVQLQTMANNHAAQQQEPIQKKENRTGLPDELKSGVENLSGYSMDDVNVHRNSDKPAELQAHAFAQGTDIHLGAGQEKHLPHEAWHVVQQKQGRVKPTKQLKGKANINDDVGLEREADVMGAKALQMSSRSSPNLNSTILTPRPLYQRYPAIQRVKFSEEFSPSKMVGWLGGKTLRGGADVASNLALGIASERAIDYVNKKTVEIGSQEAINELVKLISPVLVPGVGAVVTAISIASKVATVLEKIISFWQHLTNEVRVFIYYIAGSFQGYVLGENNISNYLIGDGQIDQDKMTAIVTKLKTVGSISQMPVEAVKGAASWAVSSTADYARSWAETATSYSGSALKYVGSYFWGAEVGEGLRSGFQNEASPAPEAIQESIDKIKSLISEDSKQPEEADRKAEEQSTEAGKGGESKLPTTPFRLLEIGPLKFGLFKMATERGGGNLTGGLVLDAGFQLALFENKIPESLVPFVRISIPWFLSNYSLIPKMGMIDAMGNTYEFEEENRGKVTLKQLEPINIPINKDFNIVNIGTLTIKDATGDDDGLKSATLAIDKLKIAKDTLNLSDFSAQWDAANGVTFKTKAEFILGDVKYFSSNADLTIDEKGKFTKGALSNFDASVLPAPFDKLTVKSASIEEGGINVNSAELVFKEGYGIKKVTIENLNVDKNGNYDLNTKSTFEGLEFFDGKLEFNEAEIDLGISSKDGWKIKGSSILKAGKDNKDMSARGEVVVSYNNSSKELTFELNNGEIHAELFNSLMIDGTKVTYKDGKFTIGKGDIKIKTSYFPETSGNITELNISKEGIDWKSAKASIATFDLWGLKISETTAEVAGKEKGHETIIKGGLGADFDDYLGFKGDGALKFDPSKDEINLNEVNTNLYGNLNLPGSLLPVWPINFMVFFPIVPGLEAHGGIEINGGVQLVLDGNLKKTDENPAWEITGSSKNEASLVANIKAGLTAGSGYLVGLSGSLFAGVESKAIANITLGGAFILDIKGINMDKSEFAYELSAKLLANIGASIEGRALGIFHKKLYEVKLAEYELGDYEFTGSSSFSSEGKPKTVTQNPKFQGSISGGKANEPKYSVIQEDEKVQELLLDAKANIIDIDGEKRKEILSKLTIGVKEQASSLLRKHQDLKAIFDGHMKELMEIILRKDVYFRKYIDSPGIEEKLKNFDDSHNLTQKKNTIRDEGNNLDQLEAELNKILKIMNDVESEISGADMEESSGNKGDKVKNGKLETDQIGEQLGKINTNISFSGIQEGLTKLGADALTLEVSASIMTKDKFVEISTTKGFLGGENERKRVKIVDDSLAKYDSLRKKSKDEQIKFLTENLLPEVIKYSELSFSSRTEAALLLKFQIEQAISRLRRSN